MSRYDWRGREDENRENRERWERRPLELRQRNDREYADPNNPYQQGPRPVPNYDERMHVSSAYPHRSYYSWGDRTFRHTGLERDDASLYGAGRYDQSTGGYSYSPGVDRDQEREARLGDYDWESVARIYHNPAESRRTGGDGGGEGRSSFSRHTGRGPRNFQRRDERIADDIHQLLSRQDLFDARELEIAVSGGIVTLKGGVLQRRDKRTAEEMIESVPGIKDIRNEVQVIPQS